MLKSRQKVLTLILALALVFTATPFAFANNEEMGIGASIGEQADGIGFEARTGTIIYDMQDELRSKSGSFEYADVLQKAGDATFEISGADGNKIIAITNRGDNWHAVDIRLAALELYYGCEYEFAITGTTDPGKTVLIGQSAGTYGWKHNVTSDASGNFNLTKTFTYSELKTERDSGQNFRIQENSNVDYEIHSIVITQTGTPAEDLNVPVPSTSSLGSTVFYDMAQDSGVQGASDGAFILPALIAKSEAPSVTIKDIAGGKSLLIDGRQNDWWGLDILRDQMKVNGNFIDGRYTIYVAGHIAAGEHIPNDAKIKIGMSESPWSTLKWQGVSSENRSFALDYAVDLSGDQLSQLGHNFRIQTENAPELPFYIDSLIVKVDSRVNLSFTFSPDEKDRYEDWWVSGSSMELEWVESFGSDDNYSLKATRTTANAGGYGSLNSALRLNFPQPLPVGQYRIKAEFYVSSADNSGKHNLKAVCVLLNSESGDGNAKLPPDGSHAAPQMDTWMVVDEVSSDGYTKEIKWMDFRFFGNTEPEVADVWYLDSVVIEQLNSDIEIDEWPDPFWDLSLASIKDRYASYFDIGNIIEPSQVDDADTTAMFKHHYNIMTAENAMKPDQISRAKGSYDYTNADRLIDWANNNGQLIHGHTLVWHSQSPGWLNTGSAANRATAKANMQEYIENVAGHFKGKVISWDVVNEAFENDATYFDGSDWKTGLRTDSPWYIAYANGANISAGESGADYIYDAFVLTRQIDPGSTLFYNDYNEEVPNKRDSIALMVEDLNAKWKNDPLYDGRLLIEGIGMQSHYWIGNFDVSLTDAAISRFARTGARIIISELDMPMGTYLNQHNGRKLTAEQQKEQAVNFAKLFLIYKKHSASIDRVTFWGKADNQSWRANGMPLLFDNSFYAKQAYYAVINPEEFVSVPTAPGGNRPWESGGGSSRDSEGMSITSVFTSTMAWLEQNRIAALVENAMQQNQAFIRTNSIGTYGVRGSSWALMTGLRYEHDTVADNAVQVRVIINAPEKFTKDTLVSAYVEGPQVKQVKKFSEKWFKNKVQAIQLDQQTDWEQPVQIAAKVDLYDMDINNLVFYSYRKATNSFRHIDTPAYRIDENGYLWFTTPYAGQIIISEGVLERK